MRSTVLSANSAVFVPRHVLCPAIVLLCFVGGNSLGGVPTDLISEDFEGYELGTWPTGWTRDANAWNAGNYIALDPAGGNNKTLKFYGDQGGYWGAIAYHPCSLEDFYVDARLYMGADVSGQGGLAAYRGFIGMSQGGVTWTKPSSDLIAFSNGQVLARDGFPLASFENNRWYDVRIHQRQEGSSVTLQYWLDGVDLGVRSVQDVFCSLGGGLMHSIPVDPNLERSFDHIRIGSQAGSAYFDYIRVTGSAPATDTPLWLSGAMLFGTDETGNITGGEVWNTRGGDRWWNLWLSQGGIGGPFLNGPSDDQAAIAVPLYNGSYTFTLHGEPNVDVSHVGLNLFFNDQNVEPGISVTAATNLTSAPPAPPFSANRGVTYSLDGLANVEGAGTLTYSAGSATVTLTDFKWSYPTVNNSDRVGVFTTGAAGRSDFVGQFTLTVTGVSANPPQTVSSTFDAGKEAWTVVDVVPPLGDPPTVVGSYTPDWNPVGGNPGGHVSMAEPSGNWFFFSAPGSFLGDKTAYYGGRLSYDLMCDAVDPLWEPGVALVGEGATLYYNTNSPPPGSWTNYVAPLSPTGWRLNDYVNGREPSAAEMKSVLGNLNAVYISGDRLSGDEVSGLDNVWMMPFGRVPSEPGVHSQRERGPGGSLPPRPPDKDKLVVFAHGWDRDGTGPTGLDEFIDSLRAGIPSDNVGWDVQKYIWTKGNAQASCDGASTGGMPWDAQTALNNAKSEGAWLGQQLFEQGWREIHLIGHSAGAGVVQAALEKIKELDHENRVRLHATFLDAFNGLDGSEAKRYGGGADWADNYSAFDRDTLQFVIGWTTGGKYANAHNVDITWLDPKRWVFKDTNGDSFAVARHIWPFEWYASGDSIAGKYDGYGFHLSREAGGWGEIDALVPGNDPVVLDHTNVPMDPGYLCRWSAPLVFDDIAGTPSIAMTPSVELNGTAITLPTASPAWLATVVETEQPVNILSFTLDFTSQAGAEGLLSVYWDDELVGSIDERFVLAGIQEYVFGLPETFSPGVYLLGFRLDPFTATQSVAEIDEVTMGFAVVPEPNVLTLCGVATMTMVMLGNRLRRRSRIASRSSRGHCAPHNTIDRMPCGVQAPSA
ncbi:MAG: hypothetical protein JW809_10790 [Pirellulales bacterium]|nr:hypothetical protein [Pirellulales bacterium]